MLVGPVDSRLTGCVWHRLYIEAAVPSGGAIEIAALATETTSAPASCRVPRMAPAWAVHRLAATRDLERLDQTSRMRAGARLRRRSPSPRSLWPARLGPEAPACSPFCSSSRAARSGASPAATSGSTCTFSGDSQSSPELAAIRAYAKRFSYRDRYLPAFYRETLGGSDAVAEGAATRHDFMERLLCLFEGVLTETEGRIAGAWLLTDPSAAPDAALALDRPVDRRFRRATATARRGCARPCSPRRTRRALNGTLGGLTAALEIGTGGIFVSGGRLDPGRPAPAPGTPAVARLGDVALRALMLSMQEGGQCAMLTGGAVTTRRHRRRRRLPAAAHLRHHPRRRPGRRGGSADPRPRRLGQQLRRRHIDPRRPGPRRAARAVPQRDRPQPRRHRGCGGILRAAGAPGAGAGPRRRATRARCSGCATSSRRRSRPMSSRRSTRHAIR